ncbi:hypothetical protein [Streptomyces griseus]|uniref:hypothetical protein n=1 Tax=Streptomyces griseus TaxID=1911 RepID=UPI0037AFCF6B
MNITQATHAASNRSRVRIVGGPLDGREGFATGWRPAHDSLLLSLLDSDGHNTWTNTPVARRQVQLAAPARIPAPQPAAGPVPQTIATLITQTEAQGGFAARVSPRAWEFFVARRSTDGDVFQTCVARVGYRVTETGRNAISGTAHDVRQWLTRCPSV